MKSVALFVLACLLAIAIGRLAADNQRQNMQIETLQYQIQNQEPDPCNSGESLDDCVNRNVK